MRTISFALTAFLFAPLSILVAQERGRPMSGFDLTVQAVWSQKAEYGSRQSAPGVAVGTAYQLPISLAFELRGSYRSWESLTYVPLHLGVRYDLPINRIVTLAPFGGFGPCAMVGSDWAGFFASFDMGTRVFLSIGGDAKVRASFEAAYGRAMAFHPSAFGVLNLAGGLSIRL